MSYSQMQTMAGPPTHSEQLVQQQLQSLVERLGWSYVALWTLNPQTRNLGWKGGHWRHSGTEIWSEQFFKSTFKSCQFRMSRFRSVGMGHIEGGNIWLNGSTVLVDNAGSLAQAEFLRSARISTAIFIPSTDAVLELGTSENVREDQHLMEKIRQFFMKQILPTLGQLSAPMQAGMVNSQAPGSNFPPARSMMQPGNYASTLSPLPHLSDTSNIQSFESNSLNQQPIRRTASISSMNPDMFLQQPEDAATEGLKDNEVNLDTDNMLLQPADGRTQWRTLPATRAMVQTSQHTPINSVSAAAPNEIYYPPVQQKTRGQYRSRSGTTSSSVSSLEEAAASTRQLSVDSPEQQNMFLMSPSQRQTSHSNTSSSSRRGASSHSPEMNQHETGPASLRETQHENRQVEDEIPLDAFSLMLVEGEPLEPWPCNIYGLETGNMNLLPSDSSATNGRNHGANSYTNGTLNVVRNELQQRQASPRLPTEGPFKSWLSTGARVHAPALQKTSDRQNQDLLRRCIEMMKQIPHSNNNNVHGIQTSEGQAVMHNVGQHGPRVASSSSPETVIEMGMAHDPFNQGQPRVQRRPRGGSRIATMGAVHSGHDDAAMNHMMAERRRRVKQKENFAALRRLVPIISKADKASILGDAIVYLKDLQSQLEGLEASRAETERRYENLEKLHKDLEQRNKELESMVRSTRLHHHSM